MAKDLKDQDLEVKARMFRKRYREIFSQPKIEKLPTSTTSPSLIMTNKEPEKDTGRHA